MMCVTTSTKNSQSRTGPAFTVQFCSMAPSNGFPSQRSTPTSHLIPEELELEHDLTQDAKWESNVQVKLEKDLKQEMFLRKAHHGASILALPRDQQHIALHMLLAEAYRYQLQARKKVVPGARRLLLDAETFGALSSDVRLLMWHDHLEESPPAVVDRHPYLYAASQLQKQRLFA